jgi:hypothetical protein
MAAATPLLTLALWLGWEMAETAVDDSFLVEPAGAAVVQTRRLAPRAAVERPFVAFTTPPLAAAIAKGRQGDVEDIVELTETPPASAAADVATPR